MAFKLKAGVQMFWGLSFLAVGVLLLLQTILKVDLPILRILFSIALIYLGVKMMFGTFGISINGAKFEKVATATDVVFTEGDFSARSEDRVNRNFNTVFGQSRLDLSSVESKDFDKGVEISTVFGKTEVRTPHEIPIMVESNTAFGKIDVRGEKTGSLGNGIYRSPGFDASKPHLKIEANSVFGEIVIR